MTVKLSFAYPPQSSPDKGRCPELVEGRWSKNKRRFTWKIKIKKNSLLKQYANEFVISIDKDFWNEVYGEYVENKEMEQNKQELVKKYETSLSSGYGIKI
ncbi:MAG: hypothetical protein CR971_01455 [candidate division SR1 bacterium]|nr:MAG: hypothetical protein CR971_01455 [candidate division SR1 bacterium]